MLEQKQKHTVGLGDKVHKIYSESRGKGQRRGKWKRKKASGPAGSVASGKRGCSSRNPRIPRARGAKEELLLTRLRRPEDQRWARFWGESRAQPKAKRGAEQTPLQPGRLNDRTVPLPWRENKLLRTVKEKRQHRMSRS